MPRSMITLEEKRKEKFDSLKTPFQIFEGSGPIFYSYVSYKVYIAKFFTIVEKF